MQVEGVVVQTVGEDPSAGGAGGEEGGPPPFVVLGFSKKGLV